MTLMIFTNNTILSPRLRAIPFQLSSSARKILPSRCRYSQMGHDGLNPLIPKRKHANFRLCNVSGHKTELLEIRAEDPTLHVLFISGNPGIISFYIDFLESLYELLGGAASVTAIGHISHTRRNWEHRRLFSLQDQIDHKVHFIEQELQNLGVPLYLVGHSIGSYISMEVCRRHHEKVSYFIGLYPFVATNGRSSTQSLIRNISVSPILCSILSSIMAMLGKLPTSVLKFLARKTIAKSWSPSAVEVLCTYILQYHIMRNVLFMVMTEFKTMSETLDWSFMREKKSKMAFLFGTDDHWGPLHLFEEMLKQVPGAAVALENEGHTHAFSCTEAGSLWVAHHVANLIKKSVN